MTTSLGKVRCLRATLAALVVAATMMSVRVAQAHPHVWIDAVVEAWFVKGAVTELRVTWTFDDFFSAMAIDDFDENRKRSLDDAELQKLASVSEETLAASGYFTRIAIDGSALSVEAVRDFAAAVTDKGQLRYTFTVTLPEPVDPSQRDFSIALYDDNYYVDVALNKADPVRLRGEMPLACTFAVAEDRSQSFYLGMIHPMRVRIQCLRV
jgi:ABC-type uncharacterized transport system substrate-binding protein